MDPPHSTAGRVSKLKKRFLDVLSGSVKLDPRGAALFLEGLCAQDDPAACLGAITDSAHGLSAIQSAMQSDLSVRFVNELGCAVLEYLFRASDVGGDAFDDLLFHVVDPPIFWGVFVRTFQQGALSEDAQLVFARTLSRLLTLRDRDVSSFREIAAQPSVQDSLAASPRHEIREMGHLIKHILSAATSGTAHGVLDGPGGRHDNDFVDYRDIAILPTADEILCRKPPFLRSAFHDELHSSETPVKDYLDNTFRMLREDMVFDIRQEVQVALQKGGKHRGLRVNGVSMVGVHFGANDRKTRWGIKLQCSSDLSQLKGIKEVNDRVNFLTRDPRGSKILRHQSLVCLVSGEDIISFGTVNRVEELLACKPPVIVLQLDGEVNIRKALTSLCTSKNVQLIQIDVALFAFEPVLSALKTHDVALSSDILLWSPGSPLQSTRLRVTLPHITSQLISNPSIQLDSLLDLPKPIRLDDAQAKSVVAGLQQRVSLIQGPPGTGKSFIGVILAKAIYDETAQIILVVCYTNHALDQFLCDLLEFDIPAHSIVRLGGRPNQSTDHLSLHRQPRSRVQYDWAEIHDCRSSSLGHESRLKARIDALLDVDDENLLSHLELEHHEFFEAFSVPSETEDGMTLVGQNGQAIDKNYLLTRWTRGQDPGALSGEPHVQALAGVWGMSRPARQQSLDKWRRELIAKELESICENGAKYNNYQDLIKREFGKSTASILQQKRIIACTTTGAAIYADALKQVAPEVLLVEEAGEILESHILTALSSEVDRMILIGDHKQLRPKVSNYQLSVESGEGFDMNRSLFERLVLKGYPHETLSTQHRMRPEIAAFVRELTYPELTNAPSTHGRPDIRGVQSNIIFMDHTQPEDDNSLLSDRADGGTKASKQNTYEVQMVLKIVRYLAQQGYKSEDIVVLTPYLGQLSKLRDALKRDNDLILNELDSLDLTRAGLSPSAQPETKGKKNRLHLATIDNYQGEESDIVIASLTRSNKSNAIGFMDSPERLNVLLSRARNGLILVGNSRTFLHSRKGGALWKRFFALLEEGGHVYQGFPVKCERHPERTALVKRAIDFDSHCPDGGCTEPCGFVLACGHACVMKCHPDRASTANDPHDASRCRHGMNAPCPAGHHRLVWECGRGRPGACSECAREAERAEEIARAAREAQRKREEAEAAHRRRLDELETERAAVERRRLQEEEAARLREEEERERERERERARAVEERRRQEEERKRLEERVRLEEQRKEEERKRQEERARVVEEWRRQEEERKWLEEQARLGEQREEEEERKRLEEQARLWTEWKRHEEERKRQQEQARLVEEWRKQEEVRKRQEEQARLAEERKRQEEQARLWAEWRKQEEERKRQEEQKKRDEATRKIELYAAERRERLVAERRQEDIRAAAVARAKEYAAEREGAAKGSESLWGGWTRQQAGGVRLREEEEERRKQEEEKKRSEESKRSEQEALKRMETRKRMEEYEKEAERRRQEQVAAAERQERLVAEIERRQEEIRGAAAARAREYAAERERAAKSSEPSRCAVQ